MDSLKVIKSIMEEQIGECAEHKGILRAFAKDVGYYNGMAIIEASWVGFKDGAKNSRPVLQIHSTLAQNIEDEIVPELKQKLMELNSVTMLGAYAYYEPLKQIYHCYRLPVAMDNEAELRSQVGYCLEQIRRQLDAFGDYVMILADNPTEMTMTDYIIGTHADTILEECLGVLNHWIENEEQ